MLFVESRKSDHDIDSASRTSLLGRLQERGLVPLIRSARLHAYELALQPSPERASEMERLVTAWAEREGDAPYVAGDVFCFEDHALFLVFNDDEDEGREGLRAGIVYRDDTDEPVQKLEAFCRNIEESLASGRGGGGNSAGAGSNGGDSELSTEGDASGVGGWRRTEPRAHEGFLRFASARETDAAQAQPRGKTPTDAERTRALDLLEDAETRRALRRLMEVQAVGRSAEPLTKGGADETLAEPLLGQLASAGLARREVQVSCRKVGRSLFRLPSLDAFQMVAAISAVCSECGAAITDERVDELVKPTELALSLLKDGAWMSSRLRALLQEELGLREPEVAARPSGEDGEVHLMANVSGEPFLFYVRDGDITSAHARRALDLEADTDAAHLVLISTGKIQDEARVRLREHARRHAHRRSNTEVLLIEGVDAASAELRHAFERVAQRTLAAELYALDASLGLSVGHMIATRFRLMQKTGVLQDLAASAAATLSGSLREI